MVLKKCRNELRLSNCTTIYYCIKKAPEGRYISRQYHTQINICIQTRIYIITKTEIEKPMNRLKDILFISFPTNKIRGLLL